MGPELSVDGTRVIEMVQIPSPSLPNSVQIDP